MGPKQQAALAVAGLLVGLSGCIKAPLLSAQEACAQNGLIVSTAGGKSVGGTVGREAGRFGGTDYGCARPRNEQDMCEIAAFAHMADEKMSFRTTLRNLLIGAGYIVYVVPGVVLYFVFDHQRNKVMRKGDRIRLSVLTSCASPTGLNR